MRRLAILIGVVLVLGALVVLLRPARRADPPADDTLPGKSTQARRPGRANKPLYSGPASLAEWTVDPAGLDRASDQGEWEFSEGKLTSWEGGSIARRIPVPDVAKLRFRLGWESSLRFRAMLLADAGDTLQPDNCYDLVIQRRFVYLRKRWRTGKQGGARVIGRPHVLSLAEASEAEFEICFHRPSGTIALFVNGTRAQVWKDPELDEGVPGSWVHFVAEESCPVELSAIVVDRWDGLYPDPSDQTAPYYEPDPDWVKQLEPPGAWQPVDQCRKERQEIRDRLETALRTAEGPERNVAQHAAIRATVEAQRRLDEAVMQLPEARPDEERPGYVINPFTGASLDVRGVPAGTRVWDPRSGRPDQFFRVP